MFDLKEAFEPSDPPADSLPINRRSGLLHSTRVATPGGWRVAESIALGDEVLTFDNGFQRVTGIERVLNWPDHASCPDHAAPFEVPAHALGNSERLLMLPNQLVLVESDLAEQMTGDPFALLTVEMLAGWKGISRVTPRAPHLVIVLHFGQDEVIYAGDGALLHCQSDAGILDCIHSEVAYLPLERAEARAVVEDLHAREVLAA
ncbi:MAG: Hint domain-containing protein [Pseudomonadota bacterium]